MNRVTNKVQAGKDSLLWSPCEAVAGLHQSVAAGVACVRLRSSRKIRHCGIPDKPWKQDLRLLRPNADRAGRSLRQLLRVGPSPSLCNHNCDLEIVPGV